VVQFPSEQSRAGYFSAAMEDFSEFIHGQSLVDIPMHEGHFTWSNNWVWSKIDRLLLSPEWEKHYPDVSQRRLPRLLSDHFPLLLDCGTHREAKDILNLKTCGSNPMVLWNKCKGGGSLKIFKACQVMC
jgi:hypothetical protein